MLAQEWKGVQQTITLLLLEFVGVDIQLLASQWRHYGGVTWAVTKTDAKYFLTGKNSPPYTFFMEKQCFIKAG
ncbi:MAG: hypothetical protein NTV33_12810 [Coprothermobacterota bacterium]|nr:hypothetical protein [Coprothermobacterota bacterium]